MRAQSKHCQTNTPFTPARWLLSLLFLSLLKFHIGIPGCHSASLALSLSQQPVTKSASFNKEMNICKVAHTCGTQSKLFLRQPAPAAALYVWDESLLQVLCLRASTGVSFSCLLRRSPSAANPPISLSLFSVVSPSDLPSLWVLSPPLLSLPPSSTAPFHLSGAPLGDHRRGGLISHHASHCFPDWLPPVSL